MDLSDFRRTVGETGVHASGANPSGPLWIYNRTPGSQGTHVVGGLTGGGISEVGYWYYPAAGSQPIYTISHGIDRPVGVAVSLKKQKDVSAASTSSAASDPCRIPIGYVGGSLASAIDSLRALAFAALCSCLLIAALPATTATARAGDASATGVIDTECDAIEDAVSTLHPVHLAYRSGGWSVLSDADFAEVEKAGGAAALADVYKLESAYVWVVAQSFGASGPQRATQLCFRSRDGTLERARQGETLPDVDTGFAASAYYADDGTLIKKTVLFDQDDALAVKSVQALPFFKLLPP